MLVGHSYGGAVITEAGTGAAWQRAALAAAEGGQDRGGALATMLERYLHCADTGMRVRAWPVS